MKYIHHKGKYTATISGGRAIIFNKNEETVGHLPEEVVTQSYDWGEYTEQTDELLQLFKSLNTNG